ncbi:Coat F domain protein [Sporotomaculum syntrophicum]|uniref:Coat F domain protein n=1 Tax=Sporotomaculum syntrophicum TaxID=182264 RepID=A0A9D2WMW5_9FIRM|nr:spore coat protein [Sporotomaculum syntrophicum]KAF1084124.1 Coat F domain protein [Sporotomaculum syntrophicum]
MQFSDREIMADVFVNTKYVSANYHRAVLESANDRVRDTLIQLNNEEINLQKQIINLMHDRNWCEVRPANSSSGLWQAKGQGRGPDAMHYQMPY